MVHRRDRRCELAPLAALGAALRGGRVRRFPGDPLIGAGGAAAHPLARPFGGVAELYERARPGYPDAAVAELVSRLELGEGRVVADLAAGTGKLTRRLLESGARVIAVEPLAEMRTVLAQQAPAAEILAGSAEAIPLPDSSLDALTVAQAFHWFEAERALAEIARVLRPGGSLALVWNVRDLADEFQQQIDLLLAPHRGSTPSQHDRRWRDALARSPSFGREQLSSFDWSQAYTAAELVERVGSVSFVAALAPPEREALLEEVRMLGAVTPEPFPFRYRTELHFYPRLGEAPGGR